MKRAFLVFSIVTAGLCAFGGETERRLVAARPYSFIESCDGGLSEVVKELKKNGITDVVCLFSDGPVAFFPSKVMVPAPEMSARGDTDLLTPMLAALHAEGIRLHAWMTIGRLNRSPKELTDRLIAEGRVAVGKDGHTLPGFLCREDPRNIEMYRAAAAELMERGIDGIHIDYIRYSHWSDCYCERFKKLYAANGGKNLADWPNGVDGNRGIDSVWMETRAEVINGIVKAMRDEVRRHPGVELSASAFNYPSTAKVLVGQDWPRWAREGWLDFVSVMDYTTDTEDLRRELLEEMPIRAAASPKTKIYPCIAVTWSRGINTSKAVKEQIGLVRAYAPGGFGLFSWDRDTRGRIDTALREL